jgi:hypothetical protein
MTFLRHSGGAAALLSLWLAAPASAQLAADARDPVTELSRMSLEELANVEVTSVSKSAQSLSSAPASIYVITREEILRSGVLSIPEAIRLAPNMQVTQLNLRIFQWRARPGGFARRAEFLQQDAHPHRRRRSIRRCFRCRTTCRTCSWMTSSASKSFRARRHTVGRERRERRDQYHHAAADTKGALVR